jgi:hypothetical protein
VRLQFAGWRRSVDAFGERYERNPERDQGDPIAIPRGRLGRSDNDRLSLLTNG